MVVRGFQGFANSFIGTSIYSMTTIEFAEDREKYIGYVELSLGIGLMIGPVLGSLFMAITDSFEITFYIFGGLILAGGLFAFIALPNYLNKADIGPNRGITARASVVSIGVHQVERNESSDDSDEEDSVRGPDGKKIKKKKVTFGLFLAHPRSLFCLLACGASMICLLFFESTLANYLKTAYGISESENGLIFAIPCLFYAGSSPFVSLLTRRMQRRLIIYLAFLLNVVALILLGPSNLLGIPQYMEFTFVGLALNGISISFIFVPLLPEILYVVGTAEGLENNNELNDKASGIYNVAYASGTILAPNIGGVLTDLTNFRTMCDILAAFSLFFSTIFLFANVGIRTFCDVKPDPKFDPKPKRKSVKPETDPRDLLKDSQSTPLLEDNINKSVSQNPVQVAHYNPVEPLDD